MQFFGLHIHTGMDAGEVRSLNIDIDTDELEEDREVEED